VIIGIILNFAVLSINPHDPERLIAHELDRFTTLYRLAREQATLQQRPLAIQFQQRGYRFLQLPPDSDSRVQAVEWHPYSEMPLQPRTLPPELTDVLFRLTLEGLPVVLESTFDDEAEEPLQPHLFILASGESLPLQFELRLERFAEPHRCRVAGEGMWLPQLEVVCSE